MLDKSYFLDYVAGNNMPGRCFVEIYSGDLGNSVVLTEMTSNSGPSVTNAVEEIAANVMRQEDWSVEPNWIEHYPMGTLQEKDSYDLVTFSNHQRIIDDVAYASKFSGVSWTRLTEKEAGDYLGVDYKDEE